MCDLRVVMKADRSSALVPLTGMKTWESNVTTSEMTLPVLKLQ
jgi:hypothetical protein